MPGRDKTGPAGMGPMTGRGLGDCGGSRVYRRGGRSGRGFGFGRGYGRGCERGFGRRLGFGYYRDPVDVVPYDEKKGMENYIADLEREVADIKRQLEEISKIEE